jgi:hypothetical protein
MAGSAYVFIDRTTWRLVNQFGVDVGNGPVTQNGL